MIIRLVVVIVLTLLISACSSYLFNSKIKSKAKQSRYPVPTKTGKAGWYDAPTKAKVSRYPVKTKVKASRYPTKPSYKIVEGDIRVSNRKVRNAVADKGLLWPAGIVPYTVSNRFGAAQKRVIAQAMQSIEQKTMVNGEKCIEFMPQTEERDYIHLEQLRDCSSDIGKRGGKQELSLDDSCFSNGTIVHELLHVLGFYHEQSRADRDHFVNIYKENMEQGTPDYNFQKMPLGESVVHMNHPYDYDSIMHYGAYAFSRSKLSLKTIEPKIKLPAEVKLGQRTHLSYIDVIMIQMLYGCLENKRNKDPTPGVCRDKRDHCEMYGEKACTEFPTWAANNCEKTCKICTPDCRNKDEAQCNRLGKGVCTSGRYKVWAAENCAKLCGVGDCQSEEKEVCEDKVPNCSYYDKATACTGVYLHWAEGNCREYCGICTKATTTPLPTTTEKPCRDTTDCSGYTKSGCRLSFMQKRCPQYCGLCPGSKQVTTTPTPTTTVKKSGCDDKRSDCADYGTSVCRTHADWSRDNCANFCNICPSDSDTPRRTKRTTTATTTTTTTTTTPVPIRIDVGCRDVRNDCSDYGEHLCNGHHKNFMKAKCAKFCGFCYDRSDVNTRQIEPDTRIRVRRTTITTPKATTTPTTTTTTTTTPTTTRQASCKDARSDCADYTEAVCKNSPDWARDHCANFCYMCPEDEEGEVCGDKISDCADYGGILTCYTDQGWMTDNCSSYCGFC